MYTTDTIWIPFAAAIISGILATTITLIVNRSNIKRDRKLDCLRRFAAHRGTPVSKEWAAAMNEIYVTFNDCEEVISAFSTFHRATRNGTQDDHQLIIVIKSMMRHLKLNYEKIDDDLIMGFIRHTENR